MGNIISDRFTSQTAAEEQYRFWSAVASSLRLGWLGTNDKEREVKVCQFALFPMLLNASALQGDIVALQAHLQQGADVCVPDFRGRTPLHLAAGEGDVETVKYLIRKGADVNARDNSQRTPLMDAIRCKNLEAVKYLISEEAKLEMSEPELGAEMCCLAYLGDMEQMEAWKLAGAKFNFADLDGRTPLHVAVCTNQEEVVKYCMKNGSDLEVETLLKKRLDPTVVRGNAYFATIVIHCLRDRFNNRPVDDAQRLGLKNLIKLLTVKAKKPQGSTSRETAATWEDSQEDD